MRSGGGGSSNGAGPGETGLEERVARLQLAHAAIDGAHRDLAREPVQQEHDHADRRDDHAELDHHHVDDAPPHRVVAELDDHRQHEGQRDEHRRDLVEHRAQDEVAHQQDEDDGERRERQLLDRAHQRLWNPREGDEVGEDESADQDHVEHRGGARRFAQPLDQVVPRQAAARQREEERQHRRHRRGLVHGEHAAVQPAEHADDEHQHRRRLAQRGAPLRPLLALEHRRRLRVQAHHDRDRHQVERDGE